MFIKHNKLNSKYKKTHTLPYQFFKLNSTVAFITQHLKLHKHVQVRTILTAICCDVKIKPFTIVHAFL